MHLPEQGLLLRIFIEIVDTEEKIKAFLPFLDEMMEGGLATLEQVTVVWYRGHS